MCRNSNRLWGRVRRFAGGTRLCSNRTGTAVDVRTSSDRFCARYPISRYLVHERCDASLKQNKKDTHPSPTGCTGAVKWTAGIDMSEASWPSLGLSPWLASACTEMGLRRPTPIQRQCIPPSLQGRDVMGSAETGSGKTAAFALPILQALSEDPYGVFAVVLSPARELAAQIADQFVALGSNIQIGCCHHCRRGRYDAPVTAARGTTTRGHRHSRPAGGPRSSTGTATVFRNVRFLVIDEADRLLELGFSADVSGIIQQLPPKRQTLFSATMSQPLQRLRSSR